MNKKIQTAKGNVWHTEVVNDFSWMSILQLIVFEHLWMIVFDMYIWWHWYLQLMTLFMRIFQLNLQLDYSMYTMSTTMYKTNDYLFIISKWNKNIIRILNRNVKKSTCNCVKFYMFVYGSKTCGNFHYLNHVTSQISVFITWKTTK